MEEHSSSSPCDDNSHFDGNCFSCYMKHGECKNIFIEWRKCVEEGEKNDENIINKCFQITSDLRKCMETNQDHYDEALKAEEDPAYKIFMILQAQKEADRRGHEIKVVANE
ncbi:GCK [Artemisia annua]|uniref:GCK n=1 Tax=Artemisia annua TaxID=35608 RepID=A0A2U1MCX9_ARTAN|nr:GCK [Artemisia annua]PWA59115.1 GCK [Artemisia annua]